MRIKTYLLSCLILISISLNAKANDTTITVVKIKVIDTITKESVRARVYYSSLPYSKIVGLVNSSEFKFSMFEADHYSVQFDAAGYEQAKYIIDSSEANESSEIERVVELKPIGSGAQKVILLEGVLFGQNQSKIAPNSFQALDEVVVMMKNNPSMIIQLEGHTDFRGSAQGNLKLSQERVDNVKKYLTSKGVKKNRILTKAFGGTQPLSRDFNEAAMSLNRRVEMRIIQD